MKRAQTSQKCLAVLLPQKEEGENGPIKINLPEFTIGRSKNVSCVMKELFISRNHCMVKCVDGVWNILDQSSLGISVNGKKLTKNEPHVLQPGDVVALGPEPAYVYTFNVFGEPSDPSVKKKKLCVDTSQTVKNVDETDSALGHKQKQLQLKIQQACLETSAMLSEHSQLEENLDNSLEIIDTSIAQTVKSVDETESALCHKQKQLQLRIQQAHLETSVMETEHSQLEADLQNGLEMIGKRYKAEQASLMRRSANHSDRHKLQEERSALERQFKEEKEELERLMKSQMEELQRKINEKLQVEQRLVDENQQLQDELQKERNLFKERLEKEEEQVQLERRRVQELEQKHQEAIASMEEDYTMQGMLQEQEMAEKKKAYEEERKTIQSALLEKEKALEVTEKKLQEEGEVRSKFQDVLESELQCSVCNELFVCAVTLNCTHTFCQLCITQWKERKKDCPVCRAKITMETRMLVLDGFIDKAVENLSDEMKTRRAEIVEEKKIAMLVYQQKPKASSSTAAPTNTRRSARSRRASNRARTAPAPVIEENSLEEEDSIYVSSEEDEVLSLSDTVSDSSVEGEPGEYYGGYGYCYRCGRRGHWARGCPNY